jgi:AraC-like DNA-binding protein
VDNDNFLVREFKKALEKYSGDDVVNLDDKFIHKFEFFIQTYEEIFQQLGNSVAPHKWSYYRIGLLTQGSADYICGIYKFKAVKNTLVIIPARVINTSINWSPDAKGYVVVFNLDFFMQNHFPHKYIESKRILQPSVQPYIRLTEEQAGEVELIYLTIMREKQSDDPHKNELIALKIIELMILAERLYSEVQHFDSNQVVLETVKKFSDLVETNFTHYRSVSFYASQLNVHPNYLNALVKSQTGFTAKESILSRLTLEAKYLLQATSLSVKEIAGKLGFEDPNYFISFFKRCENTTPAAYRAASLKI